MSKDLQSENRIPLDLLNCQWFDQGLAEGLETKRGGWSNSRHTQLYCSITPKQFSEYQRGWWLAKQQQIETRALLFREKLDELEKQYCITVYLNPEYDNGYRTDDGVDFWFCEGQVVTTGEQELDIRKEI